MTAQLEAIDTLEQMQAKRYTYKVSERYNVNITDASIISDHTAARSGYEAYVAEMTAARIAAQEAYDALSSDEKAQISSSLVAKLDNGPLSTKFSQPTYAVTPSDGVYNFEAVKGGKGLGYEVSNHMVSGEIPQTFILVDTSDGKTSWTPSGKYVYGESNYIVTYCCDVETTLNYGTDYQRLNLEDSGYYGASSAKHIRAIMENSYPFISMDEMKSRLKSGGLSSSFVDSLTRADMIAAVQMAVWTYANVNDGAAGGLEYFASIDVTKNQGSYFTALHDYTNETWDWYPGAGLTSYDERAAYRVNNLAYYLCKLPGKAADEGAIVVSDVEITRAELVDREDGAYDVGMYVHLNNGGDANDDLKIIATSYDGSGNLVNSQNVKVNGGIEYQLTVRAHVGDTIKVVVEGTQHLEKGVYFYRPEGGRDVSQNLVGVAEGDTKVYAEKEFTFRQDIRKGIRVYKTEKDNNRPISDITFDVYKVEAGEGESLSEVSTAEEISRYATAENKVDSVTTDSTGYASLALEDGIYLIVEEHNKAKVVAPVNPFYVRIPMHVDSIMAYSEDGSAVEAVTYDIVAVYPKNEPVTPPEEEPNLPNPPDNVKGKFTIVKHDEDDESILLGGAKFEVYRAATDEDENPKIVICDGIQYAVVPVRSDGGTLTLTTGEDGRATSPSLTCGVYFLVETKAPDGYNLREEAVKVTVVSDTHAETTIVSVGNRRGHLLPETGGAGTTAILAFGSMLTLIGIIAILSRKRKISNT